MTTELISITINNWKKHNRKDVTRPTWFACSNKITENDDLFHLTGEEFKAWIHMLGKASDTQSDTIFINFEAAFRKSNINEKDYRSAIKKLSQVQIVTVNVTSTLRGSDVSVTLQTDRQTNNMSDFDKSNPTKNSFNLESIYKEYPKRKGDAQKGKGMTKLARLVKNQPDFDLALLAVKNYRAYCVTEKQINTGFVKMFSSFWDAHGDWKSWADKQSSKSQPTSQALLNQAMGITEAENA